MLVVYTPEITERIIFIMNVVFKEHLGAAFRLTDSVTSFQQASSPKISYASAPVSDEIFFWQHPITLEKDIKTQNINISLFEEEPVFFQSPDTRSLLPFDIFGMCFYLITRYEEYLPFTPDCFGRFPATESLAFKAGFLEKPLADILILKLRERLSRIFTGFAFRETKFRYIASYDIDNAYAYKNKEFIRMTGGLLRQALRCNFNEIRNRIAVLSGKKPDPCDSYDFIKQLQAKYNIETCFFILYAGQDKYDRGLSPKNKKFQRLIKELAFTGTIGIHPSFASASDIEKLKSEIKGLSRLFDKPVSSARSHFLLLRFPDTYRTFLDNGITGDFTMGYADRAGFRASTSHPFFFFDLSRNITTGLLVYPFAYMDETLRKYKALSYEDSYSVICSLIDAVKNVNGVLISLWHNDTFGRTDGARWKDVYERTIRYTVDDRFSRPL